MSIFNPSDLTSRDRVAMLQAGAAIVKDYPLTGVGPNQIEPAYPRYRVAEAVKPTNPHLHNVPMQIAAERGLPALAVWVWFVGSAVLGLLKLLRKSRHKSLAAAALGCMAAMLAAGLTEYNFGDSEFLMLLLVIITLPFAANRDGGLPS
jgi:O-antigen ligase